jgi:transposase
MGYHERDPQQRKQFLRLRERFFRRGKRPVHIDECGFASSTARRYGYAPKGQRVEGLVSGHRRPGTSLLFLPPYSPDFNPIEHDFATLKKRREY